MMLPPNYTEDGAYVRVGEEDGISVVNAETLIVFLPDGNVDIQSTRPKSTLVEQLRQLADALATQGDNDAAGASDTRDT